MNSQFSIVHLEGVSFVVFRPWWGRGDSARFDSGADLISPDALPGSSAVLRKAIGATRIANLRQNHGNVFFDARSGATVGRLLRETGTLERCEECDALLSPSAQNVPGEVVAYGVCTADCVPVVVRGEHGWAVIHAGWRGLANKIIERSALALGAPVEAALFPCAGGESYEVGWEVVEAIGSSAAYKAVLGDGARVLLDTAQTAVNQLTPLLGGGRVAASGICTITDTRFHSYRRDGERAGRALTFVTPK